MSHYYMYDDEPPSIWRKVGIGAGIVAVLVVGYLGYNSLGASPNGQGSAIAAAPASSVDDAPTSSVGDGPQPPATSSTSSTTGPATTSTTVAPAHRASTNPAATRDVSSMSTSSTTTSSSTTSTTTAPGGTPVVTLPDGSAVPVVAIFDVATITLAGAVPSQAAADRLATLAQANSKTPASIINLLSIDPSVPEGVGVRVVELTSSRFPEGSAEILMAHAAELNRITAVMNALPNTTVLVVGHADQVGSEQTNFELSERRAAAVVSYLVGTGIAPSRLSSRAVGESDLLSIASDETSLALNRRTEFVIYGALVGA